MSSFLQKLLKRETNSWRPNTNHLLARSFAENVYPNYIIHDAQIPNCVIKKFSPDGQVWFFFPKIIIITLINVQFAFFFLFF